MKGMNNLWCNKLKTLYIPCADDMVYPVDNNIFPLWIWSCLTIAYFIFSFRSSVVSTEDETHIESFLTVKWLLLHPFQEESTVCTKTDR